MKKIFQIIEIIFVNQIHFSTIVNKINCNNHNNYVQQSIKNINDDNNNNDNSTSDGLIVINVIFAIINLMINK